MEKFDFEEEWNSLTEKPEKETNRTPEFDSTFDEIWHKSLRGVVEEGLAPAVKAVPSKPSSPTPTQKSSLRDALVRSADVDGDSPEDEEEMLRIIKDELNIDPAKLKNVGLSLANVSALLG
jgi:hypothetical protein